MDDTTFTASVYYENPKAALAWLVHAFGFEITMAIDGPPEAPEACHYEMALEGKGRVMVGGQWTSDDPKPAVGWVVPTLRACTCNWPMPSMHTATRLVPRGRRLPKIRPINSTAIEPTGPSISKATCGRSQHMSAM